MVSLSKTSNVMIVASITRTCSVASQQEDGYDTGQRSESDVDGVVGGAIGYHARRRGGRHLGSLNSGSIGGGIW